MSDNKAQSPAPKVGDKVVAECTVCHVQNGIRYGEKKSMFGLKTTNYWACERCGNIQSKSPL